MKTLFYLCCLAMVFYGCANVVPPEGGEKDITPPVLLSISPADSQLNIYPKKINARFNKYMEVKDLAQHLTISPLIDIPPIVVSYGKRIAIDLVDTLLRPNTTYKISFGKALTDNRESTPIENFTYVFSTGSFFDSLSIKGQVIDALTGLPDTAMTIMLYDENIADSQIAFQKPIYIAKVNSNGVFNLDILPNLDFKMVAVQDVDNNRLYAKGLEKIGFWSSNINPSVTSELNTFIYTFLEEDSAANSKAKEAQNSASSPMRRMGRAPDNKNKKLDPGYTVLVDTNNNVNRSFDVTQHLVIKMPDDSIQLDLSKIYLSFDASGIEAEAVIKVAQVGDSVILETQWQEDKLYTLRLVKGWAKDSAQNELLPGKYLFRTKSKQDYGALIVNFADSMVAENYVALIKSDVDTIYYKPVQKTVRLPYLKPNKYSVFVFKDEDNSGVWTTGDFLLKRMPELMIPYDGTIMLRAGWDNEIDFKPFYYKMEASGASSNKLPTLNTE